MTRLSAGEAHIGSVSIDATDTTGIAKAEDAVHASGDVGVMVLAVVNTGRANLTSADGDYSAIATDRRGALTLFTMGGQIADGISRSRLVGLPDWAGNADTFHGVGMMLDNGATMDVARNNVGSTVLASAARTATPTKVDQTNYNGRSLVVVIDVTAITSSPSVVFTIQGKDPASGKYYTILASAAIVGTGTTVLRVSPHYAAAVTNLVAIDTLPRIWAVDAVHGNANSITYSVGAMVLV